MSKGTRTKQTITYNCKNKSERFKWNWVEQVLENNTLRTLVLKPYRAEDLRNDLALAEAS